MNVLIPILIFALIITTASLIVNAMINGNPHAHELRCRLGFHPYIEGTKQYIGLLFCPLCEHTEADEPVDDEFYE